MDSSKAEPFVGEYNRERKRHKCKGGCKEWLPSHVQSLYSVRSQGKVLKGEKFCTSRWKILICLQILQILFLEWERQEVDGQGVGHLKWRWLEEKSIRNEEDKILRNINDSFPSPSYSVKIANPLLGSIRSPVLYIPCFVDAINFLCLSLPPSLWTNSLLCSSKNLPGNSHLIFLCVC